MQFVRVGVRRSRIRVAVGIEGGGGIGNIVFFCRTARVKSWHADLIATAAPNVLPLGAGSVVVSVGARPTFYNSYCQAVRVVKLTETVLLLLYEYIYFFFSPSTPAPVRSIFL